jgi:hypothetical protein
MENMNKETTLKKLNNWAIKNPKIFWPISLILLIFWTRFIFNFFYNIKNKSYGSSSQSCIGNEGCISQVRSNFSNTGKTNLGEQYLGDGKFGILFLDSQHYGDSYNATVSTDCNCNVSVGSVSTVQ